ncbi:MAG: carbohydrate ABC transporter substrate-binding protein [Clostridia bacterium]|nr:carbohydrate ABC transporter substrate-binding protein [Clostridia bacterium]
MHFCLSVRFAALGLLAAMVLSSCGAAETSEISMEKASVVQEDVPQEITVWLDGTYNNYMSVLVDYFQKEHPDIPVNVEDHSGMAPEEYRVFLEASLADGTGPDVVLLWNNGNETTDYLPEMNRMMEEGLFLDVNTLGADFSECNPKVMEIGRYDGAQYIVPLNYSLGFLYTTEERMAAAGVPYHDGITLAEFASALPAFYENHPEKKAFLQYLDAQFLFPQNGLDLRDTVSDDAVLQALAGCYGDLFPGIFDSPDTALSYMFWRDAELYGDWDDDIYRSGDLLFLSGRGFDGSFESLSMYINVLYAEDMTKGETPVLFALPTVTGESPAPRMTYGLAVSGRTEQPEAVKLFLETAVGMEFQYTTTGAGISVNRNLMDRMEQFYLTEGSDPADPYLFNKTCEFERTFVEAYFSVIDGMADGIPYMDRVTSSEGFTKIREAYGR